MKIICMLIAGLLFCGTALSQQNGYRTVRSIALAKDGKSAILVVKNTDLSYYVPGYYNLIISCANSLELLKLIKE